MPFRCKRCPPALVVFRLEHPSGESSSSPVPTVAWANEPKCFTIPERTFLLGFLFPRASLKPFIETAESVHACMCVCMRQMCAYACMHVCVLRAPNPHLLWIIELPKLGCMFVCREGVAAAGGYLTVCLKRNMQGVPGGGDQWTGKCHLPTAGMGPYRPDGS